MKHLSKNLILSSFFTFSIFITCNSYAEGNAEKGKAKYAELCQQCHGEKGAGDGPVGAALPESMKPRNFKNQKMKYATDLTKFKELLLKGGAAVGLNALMPAQSALKDEEVANIYAYVLSLSK